jgi:hypothetical protein
LGRIDLPFQAVHIDDFESHRKGFNLWNTGIRTTLESGACLLTQWKALFPSLELDGMDYFLWDFGGFFDEETSLDVASVDGRGNFHLSFPYCS